MQAETVNQKTSDKERADGPAPRLFAVAPGVPFLDCLASAVLSGEIPAAEDASASSAPDPDAVASLTIYLPTRRSCRALQDAFLRCSSGRALLLPRLVAVGDLDDDAGLLSGNTAVEGDSLQPAIDPLDRYLLLTRLIMDWQPGTSEAQNLTERPTSPGQAVRLAIALTRFIDEVETENVSLDRLSELVPDDLSGHWQTTLDFLKILTVALPERLSQRGLTSPAALRNASLLAEAGRVASGQLPGGVIVAGVTGSVPATIELMDAVVRHPAGAVVLPGVDLELDADSFGALRPPQTPTGLSAEVADQTARSHPEHPQFVVSKLLARLNVPRARISVLGARTASPDVKGRAQILSEAMRPAATTDLWSTIQQRISARAAIDALRNVSLQELPTPLDEAETIALILREALETPNRTAALVTPDRLLARRVVTRLAQWGIEIDDSAGRPFRKTESGTLIELVLAAVTSGFGPLAVTSILKHPLVRLRLPLGDIRRRARNLEIAAFRTVYLGDGLADLAQAVARADADVRSGRRRERAVKVLSQQNWTDVADLVTRFTAAFEPLDALVRSGNVHKLDTLVDALATTLEALTQPAKEDGDASKTIWASEGGEIAAELFGRLREPGPDAPTLAAADFGDVLASLTAGETVRANTRVHPRLAIWGPFEARLQQPDIVVLGGLNEGTWPQLPEPGPWINRPMRSVLGLPQPEEALGRAAHDFSQLFLAETVYLTRSQKVDGKPTIPSRWLLRLRAVLAALGQSDALQCDQPWIAWAASRTSVTERRMISPPAPRPPLALRPTQLSVSDVERWIANPYTIFATRILKLQAMPPLNREPDSAIRGEIIHKTLHQFAVRHPHELPPDTAGVLIAIADDLMRDFDGHARVAAFWRPRFQRFAQWFAETEPARRQMTDAVLSEVEAALRIDCKVADFTLTARADRIDRTSSGLVIYDYKSAQDIKTLASDAQKRLRPQLLLEAALAEAGAFIGLENKVAGLAYISTAGGEPPGAQVDLAFKDLSSVASESLQALAELADRYADEATPYSAVRRTRFDYRYDDFAHLARVAEWSGQDSNNGGET